MIPAAFEYEVAESADHAVQLLAEHGEDAKLLAGGHSLLPLMKLRLARPSVLVDIGGLSDLAFIKDAGDHVEIGALTRMCDISASDVLRKSCGLLAEAAGQVGDPQVRHRATIGGSVAHGDPASDPPVALLTLDATFVVRGPGGERTVPASAFFTNFFETALGPQEILTSIRVPKLPATAGWSYQKFHRRAIDWAIVGVAAVVERDDGTVKRAAVGLTNMGTTPLRAASVESALAGGSTSGDAFAAAAAHAPEGTSPPSDTNASAEYRTALSAILVRRALEAAVA